jgi:hypothetical protein
MMRSYAAGLPVLTGIVGVFCVRPALAQTASCSPMAIEAGPSVSARWPALVDRVHQAFEVRADIDRCARVELTMRGASITVAVVLPDGRSATRSLSRGEDIIPALEALLLMPQRSAQADATALEALASGPPPASAPPEPPSESSPPATREVPSVGVLTVPGGDAAEEPPAHRPTRLRVELSVLTGARIGDGQAGIGLGALSLLDLSGWLVGFEGRADRYKTVSRGAPAGAPGSGTLELALLGGRRFRVRNVALDLVAGVAEVLQGTTTFEVQSTAAGGSDVKGSSSSTVPRLLLGARVNFGALSTLRTFVGMDGELGPPRAGDGGDLPVVRRLPVWTLGLALGATVGTQ